MQSFRKNKLKLRTNNENIRDKKHECNINRGTKKIFTFSSCKIGKYEYLTSEQVLPSKQRQIIQQTKFAKQTKFAYSVLGQTLKTQTKIFENQESK